MSGPVIFVSRLAVDRGGAQGVALQAGPLVPRRKEPAAGGSGEVRAVRRDVGAPRRVGRMAGQAALLAVAGDAGADVPASLHGVAVRPGRGDHRPARVARPPGRMELLDAGPRAE